MLLSFLFVCQKVQELVTNLNRLCLRTCTFETVEYFYSVVCEPATALYVTTPVSCPYNCNIILNFKVITSFSSSGVLLLMLESTLAIFVMTPHCSLSYIAWTSLRTNFLISKQCVVDYVHQANLVVISELSMLILILLDHHSHSFILMIISTGPYSSSIFSANQWQTVGNNQVNWIQLSIPEE